MVGIGLNLQIKESLERVSDDSIDKILNNLMDDYEMDMDRIISDKESTNVRISQETLKRLQKFKYYPTESYNGVIFRLLNEMDD